MVQETPFFDPASNSGILMRLLPGAFVADGDGGFFRTRPHALRQSAPGKPADQEARNKAVACSHRVDQGAGSGGAGDEAPSVIGQTPLCTARGDYQLRPGSGHSQDLFFQRVIWQQVIGKKCNIRLW